VVGRNLEDRLEPEPMKLHRPRAASLVVGTSQEAVS